MHHVEEFAAVVQLLNYTPLLLYISNVNKCRCLNSTMNFYDTAPQPGILRTNFNQIDTKSKVCYRPITGLLNECCQSIQKVSAIHTRFTLSLIGSATNNLVMCIGCSWWFKLESQTCPPLIWLTSRVVNA